MRRAGKANRRVWKRGRDSRTGRPNDVRGRMEPRTAGRSFDLPEQTLAELRALDSAGDQFLQLHDVGGELANSFSSLVDGHWIFIEFEAKSLFVERDFLGI